MKWEDLLDNIVPIAFVAIWLLSALVRLVTRGQKGSTAPKAKRSSRLRRRIVIVALALMVLAGLAFEMSGSVGGSEGRVLRMVAFLLGAGAVLAILLVGFIRPRSPMQGEIALEPVDKRAGEIRAGKPLEPR
ncbi:MAG: hypothetical protein OES47_10440 [Acidobacteriota bacterium]|nr:hypothetical protein [Acidobacteriota bacterium]